MTQRWQIWIDRGGTFTDLVALRPDGKTVVHKLLSENPERYEDAAIQGIRDLLELEATEAIPSGQIAAVKMGTTVATNALLERKGDRTLLLITKGFRDALRIGYQNRPDLFALQIKRPELLYEQVIEVTERISVNGEELQPVDQTPLIEQLQEAYDTGIRSCAIAFLHGYRYSQHEQQVAELARNIGFTQISVSHQVSPLIKLIGRADTTVVDAYLSPILRRYVDRVEHQLNGTVNHNTVGADSPQDPPKSPPSASSGQVLERGTSTASLRKGGWGDRNLPHSSENFCLNEPVPTDTIKLMFMQSNGGLVDAQHFQGKDSILSGPAGGIVGAVKTSAQAGFEKIITFDMGGTSTDVAHYNGEYERQFDTEVAGVRVRSPMMAIHTVAAGGSSIVSFDGSRYRVGPDSAGANPGPACYRRGGPLTITDCNVLLGKLHPQFFPTVFGIDGNLPLDKDTVRQQFEVLTAEINRNTKSGERTPEQVAAGFITIAIENMANAIKKISLQRGYDVSEYTLCCFGGAGGQHACQLADTLGIRQIVIHPYAGVLSAYGMGLADIRVMRDRTVEETLTDEVLTQLQDNLIPELIQPAKTELESDDTATEKEVIKLHIKYAGSDTPLLVDFDRDRASQSPSSIPIESSFAAQHQQRYGFTLPDKSLVIETISVEVIHEMTSPPQAKKAPRTEGMVDAIAQVEMYCKSASNSSDSTWETIPVCDRNSLQPGDTIIGPALIIEPTGTNVIEPGWQATVGIADHLILSKREITTEPSSVSTDYAVAAKTVDPVLLEIFNNLFGAIAEQMGVALQNTSVSVNIKERLDFSCAVFDQQGNLVANAPHMPVHLGSMSESVKALIADKGDRLQSGDVYISNNPYNGGTHLPDITVITPVFLSESNLEKPSFYLASRGHHADLGGITPGSMPPGSTSITEEGILFDNFLLVTQGKLRSRELLDHLSSGDYPVRNPEQNIADLQAQIAANNQGIRELETIVSQYGLDTVQAYMGYVQENAETAVREAIAKLSNGEFTYAMDNGAVIKVTITVDKDQREATIDFTGTSTQLSSNFNAPASVCQAAVLYVFRTLVKDAIPLNAGCLNPLKVIIPEGSMLNPKPPAAVVAGNVETSQAIVDTLYGALGILAASQGTMNNFTFGNNKYQYYETICGGSGAGPTFNGTDGVHTHMTNSRLTDPEVLELRFPVRLQEFCIRANSGGQGQFRGGHGIVRRIQFLETMTAGILSDRRHIPPFGLAGGEPGALGCNKVERANGQMEILDSTATVELNPGDTMVIATPGGGGYGMDTKSG